jgi:orotidine 5'-phosphate decarboxylase subfamily 1
LDFINAVTVHSIPGPNILDVFKKHNLPVLLIQEMSSKDNLFTPEYINQTIQIAKQNSNIVIGMIGQYKYLKDTLLFTPGIHIDQRGDNLGQQYKNPEEAKKNGTDIFIIGRGIYKAANPIEELLKYKKACWNKI